MVAAPGLRDSFTEHGLWWLEGHEDDQIGGTLSYNPDSGAELNLLGLLSDPLTSVNHALRAGDHNFVTIYGVTTKGKPVTLLRAFNSTRQLNMPGIANETWKANLLAVGIHIASADDDAVFFESHLRFEGIEPWLEDDPYTQIISPEERSLTVVATAPRAVPFASHAEFEVLSVGSLYSDNKPSTHFRIDVVSNLAIVPPGPKSLNWHFTRAARLQELASLCTGHFLPLSSFDLRGPDIDLGGSGATRAEVHVYVQMIHPEVGSRPRHEKPVITGPELIRFNPHAVQQWFDQYELFSPAIGLFFTITGQRQMFTNIRLLLAIQALEVFHRRTSEETVMAPANFPDFAQSLVDAIPKVASPRMRDRLKGTYKFINEPSLSQRLKSIVTDLTEAFGEAPAGFDKAFLRKLVDTRNYYTHFSEALSERILDGEAMYWASRRVIFLLTLLFLQRLGISASDITPLLERHREFSQLWKSAEYPR